MKIVGLTGGIACGKSTTSKIFKQEGAVVIDADVASHTVMAKGTRCSDKIIAHFGNDILAADGSIDREKLGEIVFNDREKRKRLMSFTNMPIFIEICRQIISNYFSGTDLLILDIPLLFETKVFAYFCEATVVVDVTLESQIQRLMSRNEYTKEQAISRINSQMSRETRNSLATYVCDNNSDISTTAANLRNIISKIRSKPAILSPIRIFLLLSTISSTALLFLLYKIFMRM
eukprot:TRINITY_DN3674_c0_g1_i2.p1 TRINITY_DN3674_c0_g1~~TRINITY_DN3674_c0_g1_i2.p1  ORF type:complete len:232 (+),score=27.01 TRINITY_DN3674_c0_g1_i2:64-759(+)